MSESVAKAETKIRFALKRKIKDPETAAMLKKKLKGSEEVCAAASEWLEEMLSMDDDGWAKADLGEMRKRSVQDSRKITEYLQVIKSLLT